MALIVSDLRLVIDDGDDQMHLPWTTTRSELRPGSKDGFAFPTPFSVAGRGAQELIAEFGHSLGWEPAPSSKHRLRLQAVVHPSERWVDVVDFDWWAPPAGADMKRYLTYANAPG